MEEWYHLIRLLGEYVKEGLNTLSRIESKGESSHQRNALKRWVRRTQQLLRQFEQKFMVLQYKEAGHEGETVSLPIGENDMVTYTIPENRLIIQMKDRELGGVRLDLRPLDVEDCHEKLLSVVGKVSKSKGKTKRNSLLLEPLDLSTAYHGVRVFLL